MTERGLAARGIDTTTPNVARIYDYLLGGKDNISQVVPGLPYRDRTAVI
jgi:S-adenosyl methyltransferase